MVVMKKIWTNPQHYDMRIMYEMVNKASRNSRQGQVSAG